MPAEHDEVTMTQCDDAPAEATSETFSLVIFHESESQVISIDEKTPVTIGRTEPSDVVIPDRSVSRQHARFSVSNNNLCVEDLGSKNGTFLNGQRIENTIVKPNDVISLGGVTVWMNILESTLPLMEGFLQHEAFIKKLEEELLRSKSFSRPISLLLVHLPAAPQAETVQLAFKIRSSLRAYEFIALYSPEIIEVCLPESDEPAVRKLAGRFLSYGAERKLQLFCAANHYALANISAERMLAQSLSDLKNANSADPLLVSSRSLEPKLLSKGHKLLDTAIICNSSSIKDVISSIERMSSSSLSVLLYGETGVGKEVIARLIHNKSNRQKMPFCSVNCGSIPPTLIESILFGHERGAFTGAEKQTNGLFLEANGGTIFLDEIGELPIAAQPVLLRVLETHTIMRVGSSKDVPIDVRVISATNANLEAMCKRNAFRADLYYRLNGLSLEIPPLRARPEDIGPFVNYFIEQANRTNQRSVKGIDQDALSLLERYLWPGNVRELRNLIERSVVITSRDYIAVEDLPSSVLRAPVANRPSSELAVSSASLSNGEIGVQDLLTDDQSDFSSAMQDLERRLIRQALEKFEGNQTEAAKYLRMPRRTLVHKMGVYKIRL